MSDCLPFQCFNFLIYKQKIMTHSEKASSKIKTQSMGKLFSVCFFFLVCLFIFCTSCQGESYFQWYLEPSKKGSDKVIYLQEKNKKLSEIISELKKTAKISPSVPLSFVRTSLCEPSSPFSSSSSFFCCFGSILGTLCVQERRTCLGLSTIVKS